MEKQQALDVLSHIKPELIKRFGVHAWLYLALPCVVKLKKAVI